MERVTEISILHNAIKHLEHGGTSKDKTEAVELLKKSYNAFIGSSFYVRGECGPAYSIVAVDNAMVDRSNDSVDRYNHFVLQACTSLTGHVLRASTKDIPNGWTLVSPEDMQKRNEEQQKLRQEIIERELQDKAKEAILLPKVS